MLLEKPLIWSGKTAYIIAFHLDFIFEVEDLENVEEPQQCEAMAEREYKYLIML